MHRASEPAIDVVVVGGGPAGSVCAAKLARLGRSVVVLEKESFPRFHLGESLLPQSMPILAEIGVLEAVRARFLEKFGARFHDDRNGTKERFAFEHAWRSERDHAFQVPRDAFDTLLLDHARACGADVRQRWNVEHMRTDARGRASGVEAISPTGERTRIEARFVVDASGRDVLTARGGGTSKIVGLDQTAFYAHFEGVPRPSGKLEGDIDIVLFSGAVSSEVEGARAVATDQSVPSGGRPNWFWFIPFKDGRTSVGAVVSRAWIRDRRAQLDGARDTATALFQVAVSESATALEMLGGAARLWPRAESAADYSYRVRAMSGKGWLAIGDAGGFIDPLFSTGVHLALSGASSAAQAIDQALQAPESESEIVDVWQSHYRRGAETLILAVDAFYRGSLAAYLFTKDKHTAMRRSITSLLAGDVFDDAVWLRDAKRRIEQMLPSPEA